MNKPCYCTTCNYYIYTNIIVLTVMNQTVYVTRILIIFYKSVVRSKFKGTV